MVSSQRLKRSESNRTVRILVRTMNTRDRARRDEGGRSKESMVPTAPEDCKEMAGRSGKKLRK